MPIKRLQDSHGVALPRIGKLRKGGAKPQPNRFGQDLQHFRFTSADPDAVAAFAEAFGDQPASLRVFLAYNEPQRAFSSWQEAWASSKAGNPQLKHRCDGEYCVSWRDENGNLISDYEQRERMPCPGGCKEVGRLALLIPELVRAGFAGTVTLETHSIHDIIHIQAVLKDAYERSGGAGLMGIEFTLSREMQKISTPDGKGGRRMADKSMVKLAVTAEELERMMHMARAAALEGPGADPAGDAPATDDDEMPPPWDEDVEPIDMGEEDEPEPTPPQQAAPAKGKAAWHDDAKQWQVVVNANANLAAGFGFELEISDDNLRKSDDQKQALRWLTEQYCRSYAETLAEERGLEYVQAAMLKDVWDMKPRNPVGFKAAVEAHFTSLEPDKGETQQEEIPF